MKLEVQFAAGNSPEKEYILGFILNDFLGLDVDLLKSDDQVEFYEIRGGNKKLLIRDVFLKIELAGKWLTKDTLPAANLVYSKLELSQNDNSSIPIPIIYGNDECKVTDDQITIGLDIFGSAFFMLSRYEEAAVPKTDQHDRFAAIDSVAYQNQFLNRPIVNEYIDLLKEAISILWPSTAFRKRQYRGLVSCDVDHLRDNLAESTFRSWKKAAGDVIKRKSITEATETYNNWYNTRIRSDNRFDTFDFMMNTCERSNLKQAFYFRSDLESYDHNDPMLHALLRDIDNRGHEIGIHFGYDTYLDLTRAKEELEMLHTTLDKLGIKQPVRGGRQHYLRWRSSETAVIWDSLGLEYDSTIGYGDHIGFRSGFCCEYPLYDVRRREPLKILERPLIVMECSLLSSIYMNVTFDEAFKQMLKLYSQVKKFDGDFTLLWHNSYFSMPEHSKLFSKVVDLISK